MSVAKQQKRDKDDEAEADKKGEDEGVSEKFIADDFVATAAAGEATAAADDNDENNDDAELKPSPGGDVRRYYGLFLALLAAFFQALSNTLIKNAKFLYGSEQAMLRCLIQFAVMMSIIRCKHLSIFTSMSKEQRRLLVARGLLGGFGLICHHMAAKLIDPSDSLALFNTSVVIIAVLSRFALGEKFSILQLFALALCCLGVLLISQPSFLVTYFRPSSSLKLSLFANLTKYVSHYPNSILFEAILL